MPEETSTLSEILRNLKRTSNPGAVITGEAMQFAALGDALSVETPSEKYERAKAKRDAALAKVRKPAPSDQAGGRGPFGNSDGSPTAAQATAQGVVRSSKMARLRTAGVIGKAGKGSAEAQRRLLKDQFPEMSDEDLDENLKFQAIGESLSG
ncbi:MAG: hypothetical protein JWO57_663 [Pseudonocardiales bacterium]|nr:hypothetical protein [Pseudonocardiales bacterium]